MIRLISGASGGGNCLGVNGCQPKRGRWLTEKKGCESVFGGVLFGFEGVAAAACFCCVGVVDLKPFTHHGLDVIHFGSV
jgi:hypothetical protein